MALATWERGNPFPVLSPLSGWSTSPSKDISLLASVTSLDENEVQRRIDGGHIPYVAWINEIPVGYGWGATRTASIGELGLTFNLPSESLYLWDFATLPRWRGRGVYPHLLQAILHQELGERDQFWILYAPENHASEAGIRKAGFQPVDELFFLVAGGTSLVPLTSDARSQAGAALLGVPLLDAEIAQGKHIPCWHCGAQGQSALCSPTKREQLSHEISCACVVLK